MNGITLLKKIGEVTEKNEIYYILKGILTNLSPDEIYRFLDFKFEQNVLIRDLIFRKISRDIELNKAGGYEKLFNKLLTIFDSLPTYHKKQACAKFLYGMFPGMSEKKQKELARLLLKSKYVNDQKRAYWILRKVWDKSFIKLAIKSLKKFESPEILYLLVYKLPIDELRKNSDLIYNLLTEDLEYDFHSKILRNIFLAKVSNKYSKEISKLKNKDPISYIFIQKEMGSKVDPDYALKAYRGYDRSIYFMPKWFAEMKMWKELDEIIKSI